MYKKRLFALLSIFIIVFSLSGKANADSPCVRVTGPWQIAVSVDNMSKTFNVAPVDYVSITDEKIEAIPDYDMKLARWRRAWRLEGVKARECSVSGAIVTDSVRVVGKNKVQYVAGKDFQIDDWGCVGRLDGGRIARGEAVSVSYRYAKMRLDSVVRKADGSLVLLPGTPHVALPAQPAIAKGDKRIANIWISGPIEKLDDEHIFVIEPAPVAAAKNTDPIAKQLVPKTWKKLTDGETVRILAWGDSVTACGYLPGNERWQSQFVERLRKRFPKANIVLMTEAWGGRNSDSYRKEPKGSPKNYEEKVLALKPDLIVSEFVNDSGMSIDRVQLRYGEMLRDFKANNMEWIICTPHYVRPDWMHFTSNKNLDVDPRPYVAGLRRFASENKIALADTSLRYGKLWRQGIPYNTLMCNNINHPNAFGLKLFADAIMELFSEE